MNTRSTTCVLPEKAVAYRSNVSAADVVSVPAPGIVGLSSGGSLTDATTYYYRAVYVNAYGRSSASDIGSVEAADPDLSVLVTPTFPTGATAMDVYVSTDADPKWVARVTPEQVALGAKVTAVGTVVTGTVTPGSLVVTVAGTGLQAGDTAVVNTAYAVEPTGVTEIPCRGYGYVDIDVALQRTGDGEAAELIVVPFFKNSTDGKWYQGALQELTFGGVADTYESMRQRLRVECRGAVAMHLLVAKIAGTGATVTMHYILS